MTDDRHAAELPRRQFLKLSVGVGAAAVLAPAAPAAARTPALGPPNLCGKDTDSGPRDFLWTKVQECNKDHSKCLAYHPDYAVLNGAKGAKQTNWNYLLVPTVRIKGIECPTLWGSSAKNYWNHAWSQATTGGKGKGQVTPEAGNQIALGVNSEQGRMQDQLHIHLASIRSSVVHNDLDSKKTTIAQKTQDWGTSLFRVGSATWRVLWVPDLSQNLFKLLYYGLVSKAGEDMALQTMVVTQPGNGSGYYVLNSNVTFHGGTKTCDNLLVYY